MDTLRTRSGLGIPRIDYHQPLRPRPEGRSPSDKPSPKPKKVKKEKVKAEKKVAKLDQPLSFLTKDWKHCPVVDIDAYVNRSAEVRRKEVEDGKIPGKVKRPMNSFMLYRKAYQNRTKDWCLQNNHQVVSQVCGDSWPLEPDHIKDQFSEWARIERINHQNAHPGYKFSPTKPGAAKANKRKMSEEAASEESGLDDWEWQAGGSRSNKRRKTPRPIEQSPAPVSYPSNRDPYQQYDSREPSMERNQGAFHRSSWEYNNPGRPAPQQYQTDLRNGMYYEQAVQPFVSMPGVQDVLLKKTSAPVGVGHAFLGLPGGAGHGYDRHDYERQEHDLMHPPYPQYGTSSFPYDGSQYDRSQYEHAQPQHRIDPSLMEPTQHQFDKSHFAEYSQGNSHIPGQDEPNWHQSVYEMPSQNRQQPILPFLEAEHNPEHIHDPHMDILGDHRQGWQVESFENLGATESLGATEGEFNRWMEEEHRA